MRMASQKVPKRLPRAHHSALTPLAVIAQESLGAVARVLVDAAPPVEARRRAHGPAPHVHGRLEPEVEVPHAGHAGGKDVRTPVQEPVARIAVDAVLQPRAGAGRGRRMWSLISQFQFQSLNLSLSSSCRCGNKNRLTERCPEKGLHIYWGHCRIQRNSLFSQDTRASSFCVFAAKSQISPFNSLNHVSHQLPLL